MFTDRAFKKNKYIRRNLPQPEQLTPRQDSDGCDCSCRRLCKWCWASNTLITWRNRRHLPRDKMMIMRRDTIRLRARRSLQLR